MAEYLSISTTDAQDGIQRASRCNRTESKRSKLCVARGLDHTVRSHVHRIQIRHCETIDNAAFQSRARELSGFMGSGRLQHLTQLGLFATPSVHADRGPRTP